jgi:hypothetical protein
MYPRGMSTREIVGHLRDLYCIDISPDLISAVTDAVLEEVASWQARPLEADQRELCRCLITGEMTPGSDHPPEFGIQGLDGIRNLAMGHSRRGMIHSKDLIEERPFERRRDPFTDLSVVYMDGNYQPVVRPSAARRSGR